MTTDLTTAAPAAPADIVLTRPGRRTLPPYIVTLNCHSYIEEMADDGDWEAAFTLVLAFAPSAQHLEVPEDVYAHYLEPSDPANELRIHDDIGTMTRDSFKCNMQSPGWLAALMKDTIVNHLSRQLGTIDNEWRFHNVKAVVVRKDEANGFTRKVLRQAFPDAVYLTLSPSDGLELWPESQDDAPQNSHIMV